MPVTTLKPSAKCEPSISPEVDRLPLAPIEKFLLGNDAPDHPIVFRVLLHFRGPCDREKLSRAYRIAAARQPLLCSHIVGQGIDARWERQAHVPELAWNPFPTTSAALATLPIEPIDLQNQQGLRGRAWSLGEDVFFLLDVHHACCDGQGARQFLGEWMHLYSEMLEIEHPQLSRLHDEQLHDRANYRTAQKPIGKLEGLRNLYLTVCGKTIRLPENKTLSAGGPIDFLCEAPLSLEQTAVLRDQLKRAKMSINDVGLAASFAAFTECFPTESRRGYVTVLHPVDLRWPSDLRTPACNRVGVSFIRRKKSASQKPQQLLLSLRDQMRYVKRRYVGAEFLRGLAASDGLPGGSKRIQKRGWFIPTLQFTCLGDTTRAIHYRFKQIDGVVHIGEMQLERISGFMQLGPFVPLSLAACETNQRLSLTLRASGKHFDRATADRFLEAFVKKMIEFGELAQTFS